MAIDRTNYNALVDDDGSGAVGTIWSKNQVKTVLLDPIDTEFTDSIDWTPAIGGSGGQTGQVYSLQAGKYSHFNRMVFIQGHITLTTLGTITGNLLITGLPFNILTYAPLHWGYFTGLGVNVAWMGGYFIPSDTRIQVVHMLAAGGSGISLSIQGTLSNTSDLIFGGFYTQS